MWYVPIAIGRFFGAFFRNDNRWGLTYLILVFVLGIVALRSGGGPALLWNVPATIFEKKAPQEWSSVEQRSYNALRGLGHKTTKEILDEQAIQRGRPEPKKTWFWTYTFFSMLVLLPIVGLYVLRQEIRAWLVRLGFEARRLIASRETEGGMPTAWERFLAAFYGLRMRPAVAVAGAPAAGAAGAAARGGESVAKLLSIEMLGQVLGHLGQWLFLGRPQ